MPKRPRNATVFNEKILQFWKQAHRQLADGKPDIVIRGRRGSLINLRQQLYGCRKQMVLAAHPLANDVADITLKLNGPTGPDEPGELILTLGLVPGDTSINEQIDDFLSEALASPPRAPVHGVIANDSSSPSRVPGSADPTADDPDAGQHMAKTLDALGFRGRSASTDSKEDDSE